MSKKLCLIIVLMGCGVKGPPKPYESKSLFHSLVEEHSPQAQELKKSKKKQERSSQEMDSETQSD